MTPEQLEQIKARASKATAGPWTLEGDAGRHALAGDGGKHARRTLGAKP